MAEEDSFDDIPKLIRYVPQKPDKPTKADIKHIDTGEVNRDKRMLENMLKSKPSTSVLATPQAIHKKPQQIEISDKELTKLEKTLKVEKVPRMNEMNKAQPSTQKNVDKSKSLINQMVNKISAKNVAQELLPISNQTIGKLITELEQEKAELVEKATSYQIQLSNNPHNKNIQKELQILESGIQRFDTMKLLYLDKLELRNQNRRLLGVIENLKKENKEVKAKIAQGIQQIEAHMHNLPCDKEKALAIEIRKCQEQLRSEREMRINLEKNISNTIQNFNRLYQQADLARKIVVGQLKEIETLKLKAQQQQQQEEEGSEGEDRQNNRGQITRKRQQTKTRKREDSIPNYQQEKTALKGGYKHIIPPIPVSNLSNLNNYKHPGQKSKESQDSSQKTQRKKDKDSSDRNSNGPGNMIPPSAGKNNLEQMVQRMRANQQAFKKQ